MKAHHKVIPLNRDNSPMTTNLPEPPVDPDFSLSGYTSFLFDTQRFLNSEFVLSFDPAAIGLGVILWAVAWQQIPCGSLPDDDVQLARLSGFGRDVATFRSLKEPALHGFVKCSDGRLYHSFIVKTAIDAHESRQVKRVNGGKGGRPKKQENNLQVSNENLQVSENNLQVTKEEPNVRFSKPIEVKRSKENRREVNSSSSSARAPVPASPAAAAVSPLSVDDLQENTPALIELAKLHSINRIPERLEYFKQKCRTKGYKPDNPLETFIQSCLEDWAKLRKAGLQSVGSGQKVTNSATEAYWEQARLSAERAKALIFGNKQGDVE